MTHLGFHNVTIQYPVYSARGMSMRNQLVRISTGGLIEREAGNTQVVTALRNVTFSLNEGDAVGLIGHNGAGKTTLLRTMAGVYYPVAGEVRRSGTISTMFELGAGMDPELTGYENIVRIKTMLGLSFKQARANVADIENFTQLGNFLNFPVRTYSAGMAARLMFAIATSVHPDILLVDEIFQAGDHGFQVKAEQRMSRLIKAAGIFVFASHDMQLLKKHCNRFFKLEHGTLTEIGPNGIQI